MNVKRILQKYILEINEAISEFKNKETRKKQIPNLLTVSRLTSPIIIIPLALSNLMNYALIVTIIFALTDALDGYFARKWNVISDLGRDLDAITDKVFSGTILIVCSLFYPFLIISLLFEIIIGCINATSKIKGNDPRTIIIGKFKTASLSALIISVFASLYLNFDDDVIYYLFIQTTILQLICTISYYFIFKKYKKNKLMKIMKHNKMTEIIDDNH